MLFALVVVLVVSTEDAQASHTRELIRALEGALDPSSVVLVRATRTRPDDENLGAVARSVHADAVVSVAWSDASTPRAHLRVQRGRDDTTIDRAIEFKASDASIDRGQTVGFAIASMLPAADAPPATSVAPERPPPSPPPPPAPIGEADRVWAVDLALTTMAGIGGDAAGFGGDVGVRRRLGTLLDVRVATSLTRGILSGAQASFTLLRPRAGLGLTVMRLTGVSLAMRLEVGPWFHAVEGSGAQPTAGSRWVPASAASSELAWAVAPALATLLDVGADVAFGTTRVFVGDQQRASIPPLRVVVAGGLRLLF